MIIFKIIHYLFILLEVILIFNLMIIVHEIGHFLAARWRGLVVEKFGIWFGKPLWKKTIGSVEYSLGTIPAGGFVALPQMAPMEVMEGKVDTPREMLPPITALDKIIVAIAGPLFSVLLAVFFSVVVYFMGRPVNEAEKTTTIGFVEPESPASKAGLLPGDVVQRVDGHPVQRFMGMTESVSWYVIRSEGQSIRFDILRQGQPKQITSGFEREHTEIWERSSFRQVGIEPAFTPLIAKIAPGSDAEKAGLKINDYITGINGTPIYSPEHIQEWLEKNPAGEVVFNIERDRHPLSLHIKIQGPEVDKIAPNGPAAVAGLQPGDRVVALNGKPVFTSLAVRESLIRAENQIITLTLQSGGKTREVKLRPVRPDQPKDYKDPAIGVSWTQDSLAGISWDETGRTQIDYPSPFEQIKAATGTLVGTLSAVLSRKSDVSVQHLSGPVGIMRVYYTLFQDDHGWQKALWFSVILNINLAIMNMLPIPVLDGGHITLALIEAARRRPVNTKILIWVQSACAYVIMGFLLYVTFFDTGSFFGKKTEMKFDHPVPAVTQ